MEGGNLSKPKFVVSAIESACLDQVFIPANFCPIFVAYFESEIKSAIHQSL